MSRGPRDSYIPYSHYFFVQTQPKEISSIGLQQTFSGIAKVLSDLEFRTDSA